MKPTVSIVIPCYNVADYIDEALASAIGQTYEHIEIICVDNGSTDATIDYLSGYVSRGEIKLLHQPIKGAPAARNMGWEAAQGDWIQFLDADDIIMPNKVKHQIELLEQSTSSSSSSSFVAAAAIKTDMETGESIIWPVMPDVWHGLLQNSLGNTIANLFSRKVLEQVGGWDTSLKSSQEYDLMFRIMKHSDNVLIDTKEANSVVRLRASGSISKTDILGNKHRFLHHVSRVAIFMKANKKENYLALGDAYFQKMYLRIRLNTIDGYPDGAYFYNSILPTGFKPTSPDYDAKWFSLLKGVIGFKAVTAVQYMAAKARGRGAK